MWNMKYKQFVLCSHEYNYLCITSYIYHLIIRITFCIIFTRSTAKSAIIIKFTMFIYEVKRSKMQINKMLITLV